MKKRMIFFTLLFLAAFVQPLYAMDPAQQSVCQKEIDATMQESWFQKLKKNIEDGKPLKESMKQAAEEYAQSSSLKPDSAKLVVLTNILKIMGNTKH